MSQRLLISHKNELKESDKRFDAIYDEDGNLEDLLYHWVGYEEGIYIGPWTINIRTFDFFDQFLEDFSSIKVFCPHLKSLSDCWCVWDEKNNIFLFESDQQTKKWNAIIDGLDINDCP